MKNNGVVNLLDRLLIVLGVLIISACGSSTNLGPGTAAPDFSLQAVRGGEYRLQDLLEQPILFAFINTQADASSPTADPSRAQIVFLKSMREQYGPKGLVVLIVDAARLVTGKQPSQDQLINFTYDWQLEDIAVLNDSDGLVAKAYAVKSTPATFLIGADGIIQQRWDGFASASQLALSIDALLGAPAQRQIDTSESTATP